MRAPTTDHSDGPWMFLIAALVTGGVWFFFARWNFANGGDAVHASISDATCLRGDAAWARLQGIAALVGLVSLMAAVAFRVTTRWRRSVLARVNLGLLGALIIAWVLIALVFDPRQDLGIYGRCGLA